MQACRRWIVGALILVVPGLVVAAPDRPVISEVYQNPPGPDDGPVNRDPTNEQQSFIEIYLPTAAELASTLPADQLQLTFYEVEGDSSSSGTGLVNYRIDLPTFDLDPSNGLTPGALPRPPSGVVVLGWVDYVGSPPTGLAGTPSSRVALIDGGITTSGDFTFIAINGQQFGGTTNFPTPVAISRIHMPAEATSGIIQNGSGVYLLVNRASPGYVVRYDDKDGAFVPPLSNADLSLPSGIVLQTSALLDAFGTNDDPGFSPEGQPQSPTGTLNNELNLPPGGAFSSLVPQLRQAVGHERILIDLFAKTTEDANPLNDDPSVDAFGIYFPHSLDGPLGMPSPGRVSLTTAPPNLAVGTAAVQLFEVLAGTIAHPGLRCANDGGDFALDVSASPGTPSTAVLTALPDSSAIVDTGQTEVYPKLEVSFDPGTPVGTVATVPAFVSAVRVIPSDPAPKNSLGSTIASFMSIDPVQGTDLLGAPAGATVHIAARGLPPALPATNEFALTDLASYVAANLGGIVDDERGNGLTLVSASTDLGDPVGVDVMEDDIPEDPALFINPVSPTGQTLVGVVNGSLEQISAGTYDNAFDATGTRLKAIELAIAETRTSGAPFVSAARVSYASGNGAMGHPASGLSDVVTPRDFELALIDTNVQELGGLETGQTDDFGLIVEVGRTRAGALVTTGQWIPLSIMGGISGTDIDSVDVAPHGARTVIVYLDLDALDTVLGAETITRLFVVDGNGSSSVNVIEAFSLNVDAPPAHCGDIDANGVVEAADIDRLRGAFVDPIGSALLSEEASRCSTSGLLTPLCDLADLVILRRTLATPTLAPAIVPGCLAAPI